MSYDRKVARDTNHDWLVDLLDPGYAYSLLVKPTKPDCVVKDLPGFDYTGEYKRPKLFEWYEQPRGDKYDNVDAVECRRIIHQPYWILRKL